MDTIVSMHVTVHVKDAMQLMVCATQDANWVGEVFIARKVCALYTVLLNHMPGKQIFFKEKK